MIKHLLLVISKQELSNGAARIAHGVIREIPQAVISAEERLRRRVRITVRTMLAALFFVVSSLVALSINLSSSVTQAKSKQSVKRAKGALKLKTTGLSLTKVSKEMTYTGVASWYGKDFHNRKTASGVRYNMNAYTAAHKTLPFGTLVRVTNLANNMACYVQINDRGPYVGSRIIDLSLAAAQQLQFEHLGTAKVKLEVVTPDAAMILSDMAPFIMMQESSNSARFASSN